MGFFGNLINNLMGLKVHDNCTKNEDMTEEEEMEIIKPNTDIYGTKINRFIDLEEKTYVKYDLQKSYINKSNYSIINFETGINLTKDITPNDLNEYRKFKKEIQKLVSITEILVNNKELVIDVNPKINPQTKEYQWSYIIESLNISVSGGSYNQEQISQLDAVYKALQRALKVVIDKGLTKSSISIRCKYNFILKALDDEEIDLTSESKSRLKTILKFIEENKVCSDLIFRNWSEFVELLFECGGFVNEILWFEYVLIDKQKDSLGGGGYGDKENPEYMWAETMIYDRNMKHCSLEEIRAHIVETIDKYKPHHLVPCFFDIG